MDAEARVVVLNDAARRILGLAEDAGVAAEPRDCRRVLARHPALVRLLLDTLERGGRLSRAELVLEPGDGPPGTIGFTLSPVLGSGGAPCGAAILFRDLAPIERRDEQERLRDRLAALGQMATGLAHEIRNPLAAMEVQVGLLRRRLADRAEECELLAELRGELGAVADAVQASLEYVKPIEPARSDVDVVELLDDVVRTTRARVGFEGEVERRHAESLPSLRADEEQLRTLLANLVGNALEAMAEHPGAHPVLGLAVHTDRDDLEIAVSDTGPGVPAELREKVFHPFFTTRESGSGVGLALAQKIAVSHGGSLELLAAPAGGCVARVRLPLAEQPAGGAS